MAFLFGGNLGGSLPTGTGNKWADLGLGLVTGGQFTAAQAIARSVNDPLGIKNQASNAATQAGEALQFQKDTAAKAADALLKQPKNITPDNFLADKAKQLASLRLGLASTVTGAGGAPSAVLKSNSLAANYPGKAKLGQ